MRHLRTGSGQTGRRAFQGILFAGMVHQFGVKDRRKAACRPSRLHELGSTSLLLQNEANLTHAAIELKMYFVRRTTIMP